MPALAPAPGTPESDTALLAGVAAGDPAAYGEFYDRFAGRVYSLARGLCDDEDAAAEVHHDVFRTARRRAAEFDPALGPPATWLLDLTHARAVASVRCRAGGPGDPALADQVRAVLADLTGTRRDVLTHLYYGGCTLQDVAALLGLPDAAVRAHALDAVAGLRPGSGLPGR